MKVLKNFIYNFTYQILAVIIPIITVPYVSRVLGTEGVGIFSLTTANISIFVLIASIGVNIYGNREIAYYQNDMEKRSQVFWEINLLRLIVTLISLTMCSIFIFNAKEYQTYYWLQAIAVVAGIFDMSWFFMGLEDFKRVVTRNIVIKIASVIMIFLIVKTPDDLGNYILINVLSVLLGNISLLPSMRKKVKAVKLSELKIFHHFKPAILLFLPQISGTLFQIINKNMISLFRNVEEVGFFNQSDLLFRTFLAIVTALGVVMLPRMSALIAENDHEQVEELLRKSTEAVLAISLPMMFGLSAISKQFTPFFFGPEFSPVIVLIIIESIALPISGLLNVVGVQYLIPTNQLKYTTGSYIFGSFSNLVLNLLLIPFWGVNGSMIAFVMSELLTLLFQFWVVRNQIKIVKLFEDTWKYFVSGGVMALVVFWIINSFSFSIKLLLIDVLVGLLVYILLIIVLRVSLVTEAVQILRSKLRKKRSA